MQKIKKLMIFFVLIVGAGVGCYFWNLKQSANPLKIVDFNFERDADAVDALFHKGDNMYWMYAGNPDEYSVKFMLEHATNSQYEKRHNMILKSAMLNGKLVGFLGYYPHSKHVWQLLFLIVDQDFRKQGIAKKLLDFVVADIVKRGALRIILFTRNNNLKAQALYGNFGFKIFTSDDVGVWMSWHKA
jgi:ribosomal protein S18 acetylase RimI-like enzyme